MSLSLSAANHSSPSPGVLNRIDLNINKGSPDKATAPIDSLSTNIAEADDKQDYNNGDEAMALGSQSSESITDGDLELGSG